jgi:hypothetical protein
VEIVQPKNQSPADNQTVINLQDSMKSLLNKRGSVDSKQNNKAS